MELHGRVIRQFQHVFGGYQKADFSAFTTSDDFGRWETGDNG